jgi:hypothetical protein
MARPHTHIASICSALLCAGTFAFALTPNVAAQRAKVPPPTSHQPGPGVLPAPFCFGDGSIAPCPCDNTGARGHGCENSILSGGAQLSATGQALLSADSLQLHVRGVLPTTLNILLQGTSPLRPQPFGDGLLCVTGTVTRLYTQNAINGSLTWPKAGTDPISVRSASLGDPLVNGNTRFYQAYYRDPRAAFCSTGGGFNMSNGMGVVWTK